MRERVNRAE
jgi:hypothetical protein